jgi:hypothetical protein
LPLLLTVTCSRPVESFAMWFSTVIPGRRASVEPGIQRLWHEIPGSR